MSDTHKDNLKFCSHARVRQAERDIKNSTINAAIKHGEKIDCKNTTIYTDQNVRVILTNKNSTVITVGKNTRNTMFQLSERTKMKEKSLLHKVNVKKNSHAMCELADLYLEGELGEKNVMKAYDLFERATKMGNSHAMCKISRMYESGELGIPNQELADQWLKKAARKNNTYALAVMGQTLLVKHQEKYSAESNSPKINASKTEIFYYLNKAADKGGTRSIWTLGHIYEEGLLGEKDLPKAIEFYVKAAKIGSPSSLQSLYNMTHDGKFSIEEFEEIINNVIPFLTNTSIGMAFQIGQEQVMGNLGSNPIRGLNMIEQAALKQYDEAILQLAICYRDGIACEANLVLAQYWFIKLHNLYNTSAKEGNISSLWKLGKIYLNGNVGDIDLELAELYFKEAVENSSNPKWIYDLGILYFKGRLGNKPINTGIQLIMQSINMWQLETQQGNTNAYFEIGNAYISINAHKYAVHWLSKASSKNTDAQLCLAKIYLNYLCPEKNIPLGLKILECVILENGIDPKEAFEIAQLKLNDQIITWLKDIAQNVTQPTLTKNSNQHAFKKFAVTTLANVYESGELGKIDYNVVSQYYYQLFNEFEDIEAGNKLVWLYINENLPNEYYDRMKNWILQLPSLLESEKIHFYILADSVLLIGKAYQKGDIFPYDVKEATKWLYLASYLYQSDVSKTEIIKRDLENLPKVDCFQKEQIVSELSQITINVKMSSIKYKVMSRIMGDIFYDKKIIDQNIEKAMYWYTESTLMNNRLASLAIAKIYYHDKQDIDSSIKWYVLSIQLGNKDALEALTTIVSEHHLDSLLPFLNSYQHKSVVKESKLKKIKPLKNLEIYPKTMQERYELGKFYLNLENRQNVDVLNAAFWLRKAMKQGSINAAIELFSMYKFALLGNHLIPVADILYLDILNICYSKLKESVKLNQQGVPSVISSLDNLSLVLKAGNITSSALNQSIDILINETNNTDSKDLTQIFSGLELLKLELSSNAIDSITSNYIDINFPEEGNASQS